MTTEKDIIESVTELVENDSQLATAIEAQFVSYYGDGDPNDRQWLFEGRLANVIIFDEGNGYCTALACELKNGTTLEELEARLNQARHDCEFETKILIERYHAEYPTSVVDFKQRRFPRQAVYQAAGMQSMCQGATEGETQLTGDYAVVFFKEPGGQGHGVRIASAHGANGHESDEFWSRLERCLNPAG